MLKSLLDHRPLIWQLAKRDLAARYKGSLLGPLWALLTPAATFLLYGFVFGVVFGVRWQSATDPAGSAFAVPMLAGLIVFLFVSECISRAPTVVTGHADLVKKVAFPTEVLCVAVVASALVQALIAVALLLLWMLVSGRPVGLPFLAGLALFLPLLLFSLGVTLFLATLGVFVRDIPQVTGFANSALLLLSPVMYPLSAVPEKYAMLVRANPLTWFVEAVRDALAFDRVPPLSACLIVAAIGIAVLVAGAATFRKLKSAFVDVL